MTDRPTIDQLASALEVYASPSSWQEVAIDTGSAVLSGRATALTFVGPGRLGGHPSDRAREALSGAGPFDRYTAGLLDGIGTYAWWKDGTQFVGTTGTTLEDARRRILDEQGYKDVPDPYYEGLRR